MLSRVSSTHRFSIVIKVCSSFSSFFALKFPLHTSASPTDCAKPSSSSHKLSNTHLKSPPIDTSLVGKSVLSKCSNLLNLKVDDFIIGSNASVNELLLNISHVSPETCRKFLRFSSLNPEHVLEILLGFQLGGGNLLFDAKIVKSLWEIFKRAGDKNVGFKHLPQSYEVMESMLVGCGMVREVELLLSSMERQGTLLVSNDIFSGVIECYVNAGELEKALLMYDKMKVQCLVPSRSCYCALFELLMKDHKVFDALAIYEDLVEHRFEFSDVEAKNLEILIRALCFDGRIKEARKLLKKIVAAGWEPSAVVIYEVANVYCEKKDFEDLLCFYVEMKSAPDILVGNKIISSLARHFGIERADSFLLDLENLGFIPNEITFGILLSRSCLDGKLRDAFLYLSMIFSRGLKPDRYSYNALIGGLYKAGMEEHAIDVLNEMIDNGTEPNFATFRILLAGYSKSRRFDEVKFIMNEMINRGLIVMYPLEDPLSKAFSVLGLDPSSVKVKRENDIKNFRTEFVDELGNGLYLDTNLDEFEKAVTSVLEESLLPDFNLLVVRQCSLKDVKGALLLVDEMVNWGQELSLNALNALVRSIFESRSHIKAIPGLLHKMFQLFGQLGHENLNSLVQVLSKKRFTDESKLLLDEMCRRQIPITNATYTAVLVSFCKIGRTGDLLDCWDIARRDNWLPDWKNFVTISGYLCDRKMVKELLELFDVMLMSNSDSAMQVCNVLTEKMCSAGFTTVAHIWVNELRQQHCDLDHPVYSHLIKGYCREKRYSEALLIFDSLQAENLALSSDAVSLLIPKFCKAGRVQNAVSLKDMYLKDHPTDLLPLYTALIDGFCEARSIIGPDFEKTVKELLSGMIRSSITFPVSSYRNLVQLTCRGGMFHSALALRRLMLVQNKFPCSVTYNILIFYLVHMRKSDLVDSLLDELQETGLQLDQVGYNFVVYGFSICKDMSKSVKYLNDMISRGLRPSNRSQRKVMYHLCSNSLLEDALQLSKQIESRGWIHCYTVQHALLECLLSHGRIYQAERFLTQIIEKGLIPNAVNYDSLIRKFCQFGKVETAVNLLDQMLKKKSIPDSTSYDCIVQSLCAHNNLDRALDFYYEMLERNLKPSLDTFDALIEKLCIIRRTTEAEKLLNSMARVGETPTQRMFSSVIDRYRFENNFSKASELLKKLQQYGYEPDFMIQWSLISSLSNSTDKECNTGTQGFLSKLLLDSGFPSDSEGGAKPKLQ